MIASGLMPRSPVWLRKIPSTVSGSQGSRRGLRPAVRFAFPLGAKMYITGFPAAGQGKVRIRPDLLRRAGGFRRAVGVFPSSCNRYRGGLAAPPCGGASTTCLRQPNHSGIHEIEASPFAALLPPHGQRRRPFHKSGAAAPTATASPRSPGRRARPSRRRIRDSQLNIFHGNNPAFPNSAGPMQHRAERAAAPLRRRTHASGSRRGRPRPAGGRR